MLYDQRRHDYEQGYPSQEFVETALDGNLYPLTEPEPMDEKKTPVMTYPISWTTQLSELPKADNRLSDTLATRETGQHDATAWDRVRILTIPVISNQEYYFALVCPKLEAKLDSLRDVYRNAMPKKWSQERRKDESRKFTSEADGRSDHIWNGFEEVRGNAERKFEQSWKDAVESPLSHARLGTHKHDLLRGLLLLPHPLSNDMMDIISEDEQETKFYEWTRPGVPPKDPRKARERKGLHALRSMVDWHITLNRKENQPEDQDGVSALDRST
ncbi:hypothetical protein I302_104771 [Kwoniella bestiolae CBS 10118]|uniref:Uncharacterized protein n=1 Tax=Kwoniella bestiolae CBS 10118 TaxID=1296100 RepID=A0AAJ8K887_9TREE